MMDKELLQKFIAEKKRYPIYPPISVNTTNESGQTAVAEFMAQFYKEYEEWLKSVPNVSTKTTPKFTTLMEGVTSVLQRIGLTRKK